MADLTSNSGTTFIGAGGTVGVQVNTNTNWRFYLTGNTGIPDWLHFNGNVSEITGSESQMVTVEATKNTQSGIRSASGICESINESGLTAWTGFWQQEGSGSDEGVRLTLALKLIATGNVKYLNLININIPDSTQIFNWHSNSVIPISTGSVTTIMIEMKRNYIASYMQPLESYNYVINLTGGNHITYEPGSYRCGIGIGFNNGSYQATGGNITIVDQGEGSFTLDTSVITGGPWQV